MKTLFKIITGFLAVTGAITIALAAYLYFVDPFGLRGFINPPQDSSTAGEESTSATKVNLSPAQIFVLEKLGVDPNMIPDTIPPELEQCLANAVGEERAAQIKAGAVPTPMDLLKAKPCFTN
ncbi:MAG: hypothetical protein U1C53_02035 [Candidatus Veblenbacteria bacterium]|nr:hypothetical protein [Candidatus Veblenbacteria bacterium]MDZ4229895.1 hypothetical protein [Candidatus Veblenbacteria bacterium]